LNAVDVRLENFVRISIDGDVDRLARANISDLALFEFAVTQTSPGRSPAAVGPTWNQRTDLNRFAGDAAGFRRINLAVRELQFGFIDRPLAAA